MGLASAMSKGKKMQLIHINDIRPNEENFYEISEDVKSLASLLLKNGVNNGRVYYQEQEGDEKHYTLIGGEQRYTAIKYLYDKGEHDGFYNVLVVDRPSSSDEEALLIIEDNWQRTKSVDDRKTEILRLSAIYDNFKEKDKETLAKIRILEKEIRGFDGDTSGLEKDKEILETKLHLPKGILKREWIHSKIGLSSRQIQEYLTGTYADGVNNETIRPRRKKPNPSDPEIQRFKPLKLAMENRLGTKVSFSKNKFSISFANEMDLKRILEAMSIDDLTNHK